MRAFHRFLKLSTATAALALTISGAQALSLRDATQVALESNPEIGQAIENREAVEFELRQALGLYSPRVAVEASTGVELLSTPSRRTLGIDDDPLYPSEVGLTTTYDLFDSGYRDSERSRQSARVDGASFRVLERSEFVALQISRVYFQILLQQRIVQLSSANADFHEEMLRNVMDTVNNGRLTQADVQQVAERLAASRARVAEARETLDQAYAEFYKFVGVPFEKGSIPSRIGSDLPRTLDEAIGAARINNPRVLLAGADLDAASALVDQAESGLGPKIQLQTRAAAGYDIGGVDGITTDLSARIVLNWTIYDGGIKKAEVQEQTRRESEALLAMHQVHREVEEAVRVSWQRMRRQTELVGIYQEQLDASAGLVSSYQDQFGVGDRSLLDVLDAQNTRYNVQVLAETAGYSVRFAEYRLMAASGLLLNYLGLQAPDQADAYARKAFEAPGYEANEPRTREPLILNAPLDLTLQVN